MRRIISVLFILLMLVQAIPVMHFFSSQKGVFYVYIDEEKPDGKSKEKKDGKECLSAFYLPVSEQVITPLFTTGIDSQYAWPFLDSLTPPPDHHS